MTSDEKLRQVVGAVLEIDPAGVGPETSTDTVAGWDSLKQMRLVIAIEEAFGITIPDEDVVTMTSYPLIELIVKEQSGGG